MSKFCSLALFLADSSVYQKMANIQSKFKIAIVEVNNWNSEIIAREYQRPAIKGDMIVKLSKAALAILLFNWVQQWAVQATVVKRALPQLPPIPSLDITPNIADEPLPPIDGEGEHFFIRSYRLIYSILLYFL